ncbi:MAG: GDSL-type esterase/lipase family protein [Ruminococcus flavefaciens]|nr:GDSL-type esterase/lipase family protein [Ruminococcus flavefaciens]
MKKCLSLIMAASLSLSAVVSTSVFAEGTDNTAPTVNNMVVLGDSLSMSDNLSGDEYSYSQLCADYLGCNLDSFAGYNMDSERLADTLKNPSEEQKESIANSEVVVVSIGGNDMMQYGFKQLLEFASKNDLLNEGYTADDIPEKPNQDTIKAMLDQDGLKDFANGGMKEQLAINTELRAFSMNLRLTEGSNAYGENQGVIHNMIMANIEESVKAIKEINPDAQIIIQTVYQPFQLSPEFVNKNYGEGYAAMLTQLRSTLNEVTVTFREELQKVEDIEVVDVLQTFTALEDVSQSSNATPGYAYYFTDMQEPTEAEEGEKTMDFHPNQKGHVAIASALLNKIKVKDEETGEMVTPAPAVREVDPETGEEQPSLLVATLDSIEDIADYPPLAMEEIVEAIPEKVVPGDVNDDGIVDAVDATAILIEYAELSTTGVPTFTKEQNKLGDVNYDGAIDAMDATYVSMYYAYLSTLPAGEEAVNIFAFMNQEQINAAQ